MDESACATALSVAAARGWGSDRHRIGRSGCGQSHMRETRQSNGLSLGRNRTGLGHRRIRSGSNAQGEAQYAWMPAGGECMNAAHAFANAGRPPG